jgi:hypothetical protein
MIPARHSPAQALRLGLLPGRELPSPPGMLGRLSSQRPTLRCDALVHARDLQFDLRNRLGQLGDLLPERPTLLVLAVPLSCHIGRSTTVTDISPMTWPPTALAA